MVNFLIGVLPNFFKKGFWGFWKQVFARKILSYCKNIISGVVVAKQSSAEGQWRNAFEKLAYTIIYSTKIPNSVIIFWLISSSLLCWEWPQSHLVNHPIQNYVLFGRGGCTLWVVPESALDKEKKVLVAIFWSKQGKLNVFGVTATYF